MVLSVFFSIYVCTLCALMLCSMYFVDEAIFPVAKLSILKGNYI